jgi:hypothetical protein
MPQKDNILQELNELQSSLATAGSGNVYVVPDDYFDTFPELLLRRIHAMEAGNASDELSYLSPLLSSVPKKMPYTVPAGFFTDNDERIEQAIKAGKNELTTDEELKELSPLLSSLKKDIPYSVPHDYFEKLGTVIPHQKSKPSAKVVSIARQNWFRYAAAAVLIGIIAISAVLLFKNNGTATNDPEVIVNKMMKKVSTDEINNFVKMAEPVNGVADEQAPVIAQAEIKDKKEVQELIKDLSDKDIESFVEDAQSVETEDNEDASMN